MPSFIVLNCKKVTSISSGTNPPGIVKAYKEENKACYSYENEKQLIDSDGVYVETLIKYSSVVSI